MSTIIVIREAPIATWQLNRPEVLTARSAQHMPALVAELEETDGAPEILGHGLPGHEQASAAVAAIPF